MKTYWGSGGIAPDVWGSGDMAPDMWESGGIATRILNLDSRER